MRRQHYIGIQNMNQAPPGSNHIRANEQLEGMPVDGRMTKTNGEPTLFRSSLQKGIEPIKFSLSERQTRAAAFAARVTNLKYYIGLIGAKSII